MSAGEKLLILQGHQDSAKLGDEKECKEQELINGLMCQKKYFVMLSNGHHVKRLFPVLKDATRWYANQ